jgi:hypothetical protein
MMAVRELDRQHDAPGARPHRVAAAAFDERVGAARVVARRRNRYGVDLALADRFRDAVGRKRHLEQRREAARYRRTRA